MSALARAGIHDFPEITEVAAAAYTIPTDRPESDGTLQWDSTTLVTVHVTGGAQTGLGFTYGPSAIHALVQEKLADVVRGCNVFAINGCWRAMSDAVRNAGRPGICSMAIAAVDCALWDLKARLLGLSLVDLWGAAHDSVAIYGSGGFTSYDGATLQKQLAGWVEQGIPRVKMKVGRDAQRDPQRVRLARQAIGDAAQLFVDGNGGYSRKQALAMADAFAEQARVSWFEEPRPSEDLEGLRLLRDRGPAGMDIAAGEYGYTLDYFRHMLQAGAVDCLQADVTRCAGFTGFLRVAALCEAFELPLSAHCAPQLHAHVGCCVQRLRHIEYFHDHVRIDHLLFDGCLQPDDGSLVPDRSRPGLGMELKQQDAERFRTK